MDFTYFYKKKISNAADLNAHAEYDVFLSCYNTSDRAKAVLDNINCKAIHLLVLPKYLGLDLKDAKYQYFNITLSEDEAVLMTDYVAKAGIDSTMKICIDITGFFTPHLLFLIYYLQACGILNFDVIYTEPNAYNDKEQTQFSNNYNDTRQIHGFEGSHIPDTTHDILVIGSGYDDARIVDVSNKKLEATKIQLFGFPSLQPDMYQENVLKAYKAESAVGGERFLDEDKTIYAPANDPFVAAQAISNFINKEHSKKPITNLYFSPISTKPHALAFALYYLWKHDIPTSIIFPFCEEHFNDTSNGVGKIFVYTIELPVATI